MKRRVGVALDIDGVLLKGKKVLSSAIESLQLLKQHHIPHIFITNGGGCTEYAKAKDLSEKFNMNITEDQIILAHTPYRSLVDDYADKDILIIGHQHCINVMKEYGYKRIITPKDVLSAFPNAYTGIHQHHSHHTYDYKINHTCTYDIKAAFIVHDPNDWTLDMQILSDILIEPSSTIQYNHIQNRPNLRQKIPIYACNADLIYTTEHHLPRYTQGAFVEAFRYLYERFTSSRLDITYYGKPYGAQYQLAERMIQAQAKLIHHHQHHHDHHHLDQHYDHPDRHHYHDDQHHTCKDDAIEEYYGIGDNPASDVRGANDAGCRWWSVLVRTGVFQGYDDDKHDDDVADVVVDDVLAAVKHIIHHHR